MIQMELQGILRYLRPKEETRPVVNPDDVPVRRQNGFANADAISVHTVFQLRQATAEELVMLRRFRSPGTGWYYQNFNRQGGIKPCDVAVLYSIAWWPNREYLDEVRTEWRALNSDYAIDTVWHDRQEKVMRCVRRLMKAGYLWVTDDFRIELNWPLISRCNIVIGEG